MNWYRSSQEATENSRTTDDLVRDLYGLNDTANSFERRTYAAMNARTPGYALKTIAQLFLSIN